MDPDGMPDDRGRMAMSGAIRVALPQGLEPAPQQASPQRNRTTQPWDPADGIRMNRLGIQLNRLAQNLRVFAGLQVFRNRTRRSANAGKKSLTMFTVEHLAFQ